MTIYLDSTVLVAAVVEDEPRHDACLRLIELSASDVLSAIHQADAAGVRGGALYDYLHVIAARKVDAVELHSINARHFEAVTRGSGPKVVAPAQ